MKTYDFNLLRVLDAVLSTGSVTGAAERLHLSVPATSHALARLRDVLDDPLLVRAGRRLVPTPRALALREPVAQWVAQAQALATRGKSDSLASVQRVFVVRAPEGIAIAFGGALAQALRRAMPQATLRFVPETEGDSAAIREGRVDLDIGHFAPREPEVQVLELLRQKPVAVVRRGHPAAARPLTARRFAAQVHVGVQLRPGARSPVDAALAAQGLARDVVVTVPQANVAALIAARSDLVATLNERVARSMAQSIGLEVLALGFAVEAEPMVLAWHPRHEADTAHTWLRTQLLEILAAAQAD